MTIADQEYTTFILQEWQGLYHMVCQNSNLDEEIISDILVLSCSSVVQKEIDDFMSTHNEDSALLEMLLNLLLNEDYLGSDAQLGAAHYISKFHPPLLLEQKDKLLSAQKNQIHALRPFQDLPVWLLLDQ